MKRVVFMSAAAAISSELTRRTTEWDVISNLFEAVWPEMRGSHVITFTRRTTGRIRSLRDAVHMKQARRTPRRRHGNLLRNWKGSLAKFECDYKNHFLCIGDKKFELITIHPVAVFGPLILPKVSASHGVGLSKKINS